jgi:hypothetical protein
VSLTIAELVRLAIATAGDPTGLRVCSVSGV